MINFLRVLFVIILISMLWLTVDAVREQSMSDAMTQLWPNAWFKLTAAEAYFGLAAIYLWIAYRERHLYAKVLWFVLIMGLGNTAVAAYLLIQLARLPSGSSMEALLMPTRPADPRSSG